MNRRIMRRMLLPFGAALAGVIACVPGSARAANDNCFFKGSMYSDGAMSCQTGAQFRCKDGDWKATGTTCTDDSRTAARSCERNGISYSTGAASCQNGTQYRCEDGAWRSLDTACPVADSPVRAVPDTRTCMYEGATVASNSTICKGGTTFLCSGGEWTNLGTLCR
jgi:hypothetical protein